MSLRRTVWNTTNWDSRRKYFHPAVGWVEPETLTYLLLNPTATSAEIVAANLNIRAIKYGSGVTLSSLTLNMSTTATGLITNSSVDLTPYSSTVWGSTALQLTVNDGTNDFTLTPAAAGTGETLDDDLLAGWNLTSGWSVEGGAITNATTATASGALLEIYRSILTRGALYKGSFAATVQQGTAKITDTVGNLTYIANGATSYFTATLGGAGPYWVIRNSSTENTKTIVITSQAVQKVLTPSTTGILYTGGSGATFNPNAATKSITITKA